LRQIPSQHSHFAARAHTQADWMKKLVNPRYQAG